MPELTRDPVELFSPDPSIKERWLTDKIMPMITGGFGLSLACYYNFALRRPIFSGVQNHIGFSLIGIGIGVYLEKYRRNYYAEKDAVLRHYIELHRDDFPRQERKKFKEILEPWIPIR